MKINDTVYLVGSGALGLNLTDPLDCNVYAIDAGDQWFMVDAGCGRAPDQIAEHMIATGIDMARVHTLFLTHGHADHAAGARAWQERCDLQLVASSRAAKWLKTGDKNACSLEAAISAGGYPHDFKYPSANVQTKWRHNSRMQFQNGTLQAIRTDGHGVGHLSFLWQTHSQTTLFTGDALLPGGTILLTTLSESNLHQAADSAKRLAQQRFDWLCPGHGHPQSHEQAEPELAKMRERIAQLLPPENFL